jgi:hypothetical protein
MPSDLCLLWFGKEKNKNIFYNLLLIYYFLRNQNTSGLQTGVSMSYRKSQFDS